ncbi:MAG: hypothetical protein P8182_13205 [Deltaproteobacteria bacterium]
MSIKAILFLLITLLALPAFGLAQSDIIEISCPSCGYRERFIQGFDAVDQARNIQHIIVVCERTGRIRSIKIPLDPKVPVEAEPLLARQFGMGRSRLLGIKLPKFLVPGSTCPLFPITAYLEANICPIDGRPGIEYGLIGYH